jgi:hypothetical protein
VFFSIFFNVVFFLLYFFFGFFVFSFNLLVLSPDPGGEPFFSGGFSTRRHGSLDGSVIDGVQIELHGPGIRDTDENRRRFAGDLARSLKYFLEAHYGAVWSRDAGAQR